MPAINEFTFNADELRDLHNGVAAMYGEYQRLKNTLHPNIMRQFKAGIDRLEKGLERFRVAESKAEKEFDELVSMIDRELNLKIGTISLPYGIDFDSVPFPKATTLVYRKGSHPLPVRPTYKDLIKAADNILQQVQDHGSYIEGFREGDEHDNVAEANKGEIIFLMTGS